MARKALPQSRLKLRKRRRRIRLGLLTFLLMLVFAGACVATLYAPFWRISHLSVAGTQSVSPQMIEGQVGRVLAGSYLYVIPKDNILFYPKHALVASLTTRFSALASVDIKRTSFTSLSITVSEYGPYAMWCGESPQAEAPCILMDKNAVAYTPAVSVAGDAYVRYYGVLHGSTLPRQYLSVERFRTIDALLTQIAPSVKSTLAAVTVDKNNDVHATFKNGFTLIYSLTDDAAQTLKRFTLALSTDIFKNRTVSDFEYLDLRFGEKLYYKLR